MITKMAVAFANIFMAKIEKEILRQSSIKPIFWKRFIDDVISVWDTSRNEIEEFLLKANNFHPTIKFTAEISETETTFLDKGSTRILSLTCEHTSSLQRHSNTRFSIRVTHQASQKANFIGGEALRFQQIPLKSLLKRTWGIFQHASRIEITQLQL